MCKITSKRLCLKMFIHQFCLYRQDEEMWMFLLINLLLKANFQWIDNTNFSRCILHLNINIIETQMKVFMTQSLKAYLYKWLISLLCPFATLCASVKDTLVVHRSFENLFVCRFTGCFEINLQGLGPSHADRPSR